MLIDLHAFPDRSYPLQWGIALSVYSVMHWVWQDTEYWIYEADGPRGSLYRCTCRIHTTYTIQNLYKDAWQCPACWPPVGWVRTPVLFFAVCGPKYTELSLPVRKCPYSLHCRFPIDDVLLRSGDIRDHVAKSPKFWCFAAAKFRGLRKFLTEFYKSGSLSKLVTIGQATSQIRRCKKEDLNYSDKTEWPAASGYKN